MDPREAGRGAGCARCTRPGPGPGPATGSSDGQMEPNRGPCPPAGPWPPPPTRSVMPVAEAPCSVVTLIQSSVMPYPQISAAGRVRELAPRVGDDADPWVRCNFREERLRDPAPAAPQRVLDSHGADGGQVTCTSATSCGLESLPVRLLPNERRYSVCLTRHAACCRASDGARTRATKARDKARRKCRKRHRSAQAWPCR